MIEVKGLTKYYGPLAAIEDVSFEVGRGEIIGFLGPNGAGKTTTMRILTGFSPPTSGKAIVAGFDISADPIKVKQRVGYMPESVPLYSEMVVQGFLRYVAEVKGVPSRERASEVGRVMERCGLTHMSRRIVGNLSKGYRQRVGLAQALVGSPPVLILDEPTVGLDPKQIVEIRQMIKELAEEHTVLLSTHILPEVAMVCQRVVIINRGHIVAKDTMSNLAASEEATIEVDAKGDTERILRALRAVEGVTEVKSLAAERYAVEAKRRDGLSYAISQALIDGGFGIGKLEERRRSLEDVFIEAISADSGDAA